MNLPVTLALAAHLLLLAGGDVRAVGEPAAADVRWRLLQVQVVDEHGRPAAGVRAGLAGLERGSRSSIEAAAPSRHWDFTTDASGRFRVRFVQANAHQFHDATQQWFPGYGTFYLIATTEWSGAVVSPAIVNPDEKSGTRWLARGNKEWQRPKITLSKELTRITLRLRRGVAVAVRVVDTAGRPCAGCPVGVYHDLGYASHTGYGGELFRRYATTDQAGNFEFRDVYPNTFYLEIGDETSRYWVKTRRGRQWINERLDVVPVPRGARRVRVEAMVSREPLYRYHGRVVDSSGDPIAVAVITVGESKHREPRTHADTHTFRNAKTDARGEWELKLAMPYATGISIRAEGFEPFTRWLDNERPSYLRPGRYDYKLRASVR